MVGAVIAALTDWATYRLSSKLMGPGSAAGAVRSLFSYRHLEPSLKCLVLPVYHVTIPRPCPSEVTLKLSRNALDDFGTALLPFPPGWRAEGYRRR